MMRFLFAITLLVLSLPCWAQGPPPGVSSDGRPTGSIDPNLESEDDLPDSIIITYFKIDRLEKQFAYKDSMLHSQAHNYDPARKADVDYIHLGNQGSAADNLRYEKDAYIGFHAGQRQYDLYNFKLTDFKFFTGNVPFVGASFSPMGSQDNFVITADYSRSFEDGISVAANYRRIYQNGIYLSQATKLTNFGVSFRYIHPLKRYRAFLSMISNVNQEDNNGGPQFLSDLDSSERGNRDLIAVNIEGATTRHQQKYYSLINYYKLNSKYSNRDLSLRYDIGLDSRYYKYSDPATVGVKDQTFYGDIFLTDTRGVRKYKRVRKINNALYLYLADKERLNIKAGIIYDRYAFDQDKGADVEKSGYDNIYLDLDGNIPFLKNLTLITKAQLGIGDGTGDFNIDGSLDWDHSSTAVIPDSSFIKPVGSDFYGILTIPKLKLKAELHQHLESNAIYFDSTATPRQSKNLYSATTLTISNKIKVGILNLENSLLLQLMNNNLYGKPTYWSKHNFYFQFYMFKKSLHSRWGVETRFSSAYDGLAYNPVVGTFHQSGGSQVDLYPMTDVYFSGKVKKFKIFVKLENLLQVIDDSRVEYRLENYPSQDWRIRFGVSWLFLG